jgi:hypothetical protein
MACTRTSPVVVFEQDPPIVTFLVLIDEEPFHNFFNYAPELHVVDSGGDCHLMMRLESLGDSKLATVSEPDGDLVAFYAALAAMPLNVRYKAQIYLNYIEPISNELGLYDIVDPYWMDYIPPVDLVPGFYSGEEKFDLTIPVEIPWDLRESYRLRGTSDG